MTTFTSSILRPEIEKMPPVLADSSSRLPVKVDQTKKTLLNAAGGTGAAGGKSFAASMEKAKNAGHTEGAKNSFMPKAPIAPMGHTQQRFEEVLGDSMGLADVRALATMSQMMSANAAPKGSTPDMGFTMGGSGKLLGAITGRISPVAEGHASVAAKKANLPPSTAGSKGSSLGAGTGAGADKADDEGAQTVTGALSSKFESGKDGIASIGYDSCGGTSYGKYQLASAVGTMGQFIKFLRKESPAMAKRLTAAGEADTGSRSGAMPAVWKKIAAETPKLFENLQEKFIHESHYKPALDAVTEKTGLAPEKMSVAVQEVLWSTAVQHGPGAAARMFARAVDKLKAQNKQPGSEEFDKSLIEKVYAMRSNQFGSSSERVQSAVQSRLKEEKSMALAMVTSTQAPPTTTLATATTFNSTATA